MTDKSGILDDFEDGLKLYRDKEFAKAEMIFGRLAASHQDETSRLYRERCREYLATPPPEDWDGVYTAKTK